MKKGIPVFISLVAAALICSAHAHEHFRQRIPNGNRVPNPCQAGEIWHGVGHQSPAGRNARNPFGWDFRAEGFKWTASLCRKDSDGDGLTNGQELGDPDCVWTPGATPTRTTGLSHPGICPLDSTTCINSWTVCPNAKAFNCPALSDPGVTVRNFTLKETKVPAVETTYICQAFELSNSATPVHMIGSRPIIVNKNVMHHMIMYACESKPPDSLFSTPEQNCFMTPHDCQEILNLWTIGLEGECINSNAGFPIGGAGYRYAVLQLHWTSSMENTNFKDASGFSLYFTSNLRKNHMGVLMYGEINLAIPPRQPEVSFNHTCPSVCTKHIHPITRHITTAGIHMHTRGIKGRISLWRNGTHVHDLLPMDKYDYNSPKMIAFEPPIEYMPGDEVKTECYFTGEKSNDTIFYGEGTSQEMCFSFLYYYPNDINIDTFGKLGQCVAVSGINTCWLWMNQYSKTHIPQIERDCNITDMISGVIPTQVLDQMTNKNCFNQTGCHPTCRNYLRDELWPSNACYDPKRAREMAEVLTIREPKDPFPNLMEHNAAGREKIERTLFGQRSCEREISRLAELDRTDRTGPIVEAHGSASGLTPGDPSIFIMGSLWCWSLWTAFGS